MSSTILERFQVFKQVGDGSFGSVFLAENKETGEQVAIKQMKQKYEKWEDCLALREIKSLKKLSNHENIIKLKEVIRETDGTLAFVFEFMESNLYERIKARDGNRFPTKVVKDLIYQILKGLAFMHRSGYFHRDLKPENLLTKGDRIVIADLGLAREIRSRPPYTEYVSTRWYRAPEVILNQTNYSSPIDIWAVGTILAELITLEPLFPGQSEIDQIHRICSVLGPPTATSDSIDEFGGMVGVQQYYTQSNTQNLDYRTMKGGGPWVEGIKLAKTMSFKFQPATPPQLHTIIPDAPVEALQLIADMLRYDPSKRPTAIECLKHPWFDDLHDRSPSKSGLKAKSNASKKQLYKQPVSPTAKIPHKDWSSNAKNSASPESNSAPIGDQMLPCFEIAPQDVSPILKSTTVAPFSTPYGKKFFNNSQDVYAVERSESRLSAKNDYNTSTRYNMEEIESPASIKSSKAFAKIYAPLPGILYDRNSDGFAPSSSSQSLISKIESLSSSGPRQVDSFEGKARAQLEEDWIMHQHGAPLPSQLFRNPSVAMAALGPFKKLPAVNKSLPLGRSPKNLYANSSQNRLNGSIYNEQGSFIGLHRDEIGLSVHGLSFNPQPAFHHAVSPKPMHHYTKQKHQLYQAPQQVNRTAEQIYIPPQRQQFQSSMLSQSSQQVNGNVRDDSLMTIHQSQQRHQDLIRAARDRHHGGSTWPIVPSNAAASGRSYLF